MNMKMRQALAWKESVTIGLLGNKGCGKDTVAAHLAKVHGFYHTSFAKACYQEVAQAFGVTVDELNNREVKETPVSWLALDRCRDGEFWAVALVELEKERIGLTGSGWSRSAVTGQYILSPRKALQLWGTEYRRSKDNFYWIKKVKDEIDEAGAKRVVISDLREPHEAAFVKRQDNSMVIRIERPENPFYSPGKGLGSHSSETQVASIAFDAALVNDSDIQGLVRKTDELLGVS